VKNALEATPKGGIVTVETRSEPGSVVLLVEDTGVGIPDDIKVHLFHPLYTTKANGMGLGLSYVKQVAEAHGGSVALESRVGEGTRVTVRLPDPRSTSP
jgi:signal transduction histidine kinase